MRSLSLTLGILTLALLGCAGLGGDEEASSEAKFREAQGEIPAKLSHTFGPGDTSDEAIEGQYIVRLKRTSKRGRQELKEDLASAGVKDVRALHEGHKELGGVYVLEAEGLSLEGFSKLFKDADDVEWVEQSVQYKRFSTDPYYEYQWNMAEMKLDQAHKITRGKGAVVAVVDTGVSEGKDGYSRLLKGYDFAQNDDDASDTDADKSGSGSHGTHVAGTIAQATDNNEGVAGIAPEASILPVRVFGYDARAGGITTTSEIVAAGIVWAADNGANVINLSLGGYSDANVVREACDYAYRAGVTVIAASGNDGYTDTIAYPAAYDSVIAVGATGPKGAVAYYSNQGNLLDLVAPGGDMTGDTNGDGVADGILQETTTGNNQFEYALFQGTSMASPHVAGVAALLYANGITDPDDIREALTETATDLGAKGVDSATGHGLLNPVDALNYTPTGKGRSHADKGGKAGKAGQGDDAGRGSKSGGKGGKSGSSGSARGGGKGGKSGNNRGGKAGKSGR
jgi:subtilisin family serine protease